LPGYKFPEHQRIQAAHVAFCPIKIESQISIESAANMIVIGHCGSSLRIFDSSVKSLWSKVLRDV
jgi:hypothetical protein